MNGDPQVPVALTSSSVVTSRVPNSPSNVTMNASSVCSTRVTFAGPHDLESEVLLVPRVEVGHHLLRG